MAAAKKKPSAALLCVCNDVILAGKEGTKTIVSKKRKGKYKCSVFESTSLVEVAPLDGTPPLCTASQI